MFKFHYRSWDSLQTLELIPPGHPRTMLPPCRKLLSGEVEAMLDVKKSDLPFLNRPHSPCEDCVPSFADTSSIDSIDYDLFNLPCEKPSKHADNEQECWSENEISPLDLRRRRPRTPTSKFTEMLDDSRSYQGSPTLKRRGSLGELLHRPLPEIPVRKSSRTHLSRSSSTKSQAPSVTPSLLSCLERDLSSPEPEIGIAKIVQVLSPISPAKMPSLQSDSDRMDNSDLVETPVKTFISAESTFLPNIEELSPMLQRKRSPSPTGFSPSSAINIVKRKPVASTAPPQQQDVATPPYIDMLSSPSIPTVTVRKHRRSTFKKLPKSKTVGNLSNQREEVPLALAAPSSLAVSESQWMSRVPTLPGPGSIREGLGDSNQPNPGGLKSVMNMVTTRSSSFSSSLRRNSTSWYRKARNGSSEENSLDNSSEASSTQAIGNWI